MQTYFGGTLYNKVMNEHEKELYAPQELTSDAVYLWSNESWGTLHAFSTLVAVTWILAQALLLLPDNGLVSDYLSSSSLGVLHEILPF